MRRANEAASVKSMASRLLLVSVLILSACGGGVSATAMVDSNPGLAPTAQPSAAAVATKPIATKPIATKPIADKKGDLVDQDGMKAPRNLHIDITKVEASADDSDLRLTLTLAGGLPDELPTARQELTYLFVVEADRSGEDDYWMSVENRVDGRWSPTLMDWATGQPYFDGDYPGTFQVAGNKITMVVRLVALGSPSSVRVQVITQRAKVVGHDTSFVVAEDQAPEGEQYRPNGDWLTVKLQGRTGG